MILDVHVDSHTVWVRVGSVRIPFDNPTLAEALRELAAHPLLTRAIADYRTRVRGCCLWAARPDDPNQAPWVQETGSVADHVTDFAEVRTLNDAVYRDGLTQVTGLYWVGRFDTVLVRTPVTPAGRALYYDVLGLVRDDVARLTDVVRESRRVDAWCQRTYDPAQEVDP